MKIHFKIQNKNTNPKPLHGKERIPYEKVKTKLKDLGWDSGIEYDKDFGGWYILCMKNIPQFEIRRIKPYKIISPEDLSTALKLQERLRDKLVEITPYKFYKGDRIFLLNFSNDMDFMSEANFQLFRKFFRKLGFSLKEVDKNEAKKNGDV